MKEIQVIAFDADDTLWENEPYFREAENKFCSLLEDYLPHHTVNQELFKTEIQNLPLYGYGIKGFMLSMIETILKVTENTGHVRLVEQSLMIGKEMLSKPIMLLEGVEEVLKELNGSYRMVMATKGDLMDQERKLIQSGLEKHFHHIEIMSDKKVNDYRKLLRHLDCAPENFLMVGNSLKSDVLPVLELGGYAVHIPYHITWIHEEISHSIEHPNFHQLENIKQIISILKN
ncbi:HAD family hydrolase [Cecembia rubra]|uniref:Putative hydrolase of the HAD superfamily n=1 Tax=Cecembia rubra TaxID=1485585 RepID=A0A2P8ECU1_9BACT|nr:HAD family hydrolase [Cecembia rubra]PSL07254.1 putative hydrolase of the HAD superfamily [Cecembia rubra]